MNIRKRNLYYGEIDMNEMQKHDVDSTETSLKFQHVLHCSSLI